MRLALPGGYEPVWIRRRILLPGLAAPALNLRRSPLNRILKGGNGNGGSRMSAVNERIEQVYQSAHWLAEGVLIEVCELGWPADQIAQAAREWHRTRELLAMSKRWREKVRPGDVEASDE